MNLDEARTWAMLMLDEHGLIERGWTVTWDNARRRAGVCRYRTRTIGFSRFITEQVPEREFMDTVAHEVAHALVGPAHGHDAVWRRKAVELGGSGRRTHDFFDPQAPWIGVCEHGKRFNRYKAPRSGATYCCRCPSPISGQMGSAPITWRRNRY